MKMDHSSFASAREEARPTRIVSSRRLGPARLACGAAFLLLAPLILLPYLVVLTSIVAIASLARLVGDCVVYSAEVTVGRPG